MKFSLPGSIKVVVVTLIVGSLLVSQMGYAQAPVVTHDELKQALVNAANTRKENLEQVKSFFSSDAARKALTTGHLDSNRIQKGLSTLSSEDLAKLAVQTRQAQNDFAAGALTNQQITYILIALGTAVIVLIAVK
jgi:hypothetical protein